MPGRKQAAPEWRKMTEADLSKVVGLIQAWPDSRITWPLLVERVASYVGCSWSRQALERHSAIKAAYQAVRDGRRGGTRTSPADPAETVLKRRLEALQAEVEGLKRRLERYEERFVRYEYNAAKNGLSPGLLSQPLPPIDRGRTDA
jgi:hypothetical protein